MEARKARFSDRMLDLGLKPTAIATVFVLVALLWTFLLQHVIAYPFVFLFFGAIMGSAWFGGLIAGLVSIALSFLVVVFFFIPPLYSISIAKRISELRRRVRRLRHRDYCRELCSQKG